MITKLHKRIKKYLESPQHVRTVSLVILLVIVLTIPLTVLVVQKQQDIRQSAQTATPGFRQVGVNGCGEVLNASAITANALSGDLTFKAPVRNAANTEWETKKADGGTITEEEMHQKWLDDPINGSTVAIREQHWQTAVSDTHINCNVKISYGGGDCDITFNGLGNSNKDAEKLPQGQTTTIHFQQGTNSGEGCRELVHVSAALGSGATPTAAPPPSVTPAAGTGLLQGYKRIEPSGFAVEPASSQTVSIDGGAPITTNPYGANVAAGQHTVTVSVPTGYTVKYSVCQNVATCHEDKAQWKDGPTATVNVVANEYTDLYWHYIPPAGVIQGYKRVEPSGHAVEPASAQGISLDGAAPITTNPYAFANVSAGSHTLTATVPTGYTVKYSVCQNVATCHEDKAQWKDGPSATVTVVAGQYTDLYWHYIPTATAVPSATVSPGVSPGVTTTITPTIPKTPTEFALTLTLPGIGLTGNKTPNNGTRDLVLSVLNASNQKVVSDVKGKVHFNADTGTFTGIVNVGSILPSGNYTVNVKLPQFLGKHLISNTAVNAGTTNTMPTTALISGDINNDNKLDILDYNIFVACYADKINSEGCGGRKVDADLNDDSFVDGVDYNLFLAGIKVAKQGE